MNIKTGKIKIKKIGDLVPGEIFRFSNSRDYYMVVGNRKNGKYEYIDLQDNCIVFMKENLRLKRKVVVLNAEINIKEYWDE